LTRLRIRLAAIVLAVLVAATVAACGGSSSSSSADPQQVLHQTFSNPKSITSGKLGLDLSANVQGSQSGSFTASINGPFQSSSDNTQFPQLDLSAKVSGEGAGSPSISFEGALIATESNAYVSYQGTNYQIPTQLYDQFKTAYAQQAQAAKSSGQSSSASSIFKRLGIDPSTWLTNETNEGTTDVDGQSTIHISGDADIGKIIGDLSNVAQQVPGASSQGVDPATLDQVKKAVKKAHVDIYSGESDHLLRKLAVSLDIAPPASSGSGVSDISIDFSVTLSDVNQPQTISAPPNPQPITKLSQQLGGLGLLGGLSGTPGSGGSPATKIPTPSGASSSQKAYLKCVQQAQGDPQKINNCLSKLSG
jgi:hypothetical protein